MSIPVKLSGSRAAAILGLSPYQTPVQVWLQIQEELSPGFCEKNKYELPVFEENASMRWGSGFEDEIIRMTEIIKGIKITDREKLYVKDDFISCHPDGLTTEDLIENKTTSEYYYRDNFGESETDRIPISYQIQVQHNLICCEREKCLMPVLIFPKRPDDYEKSEIFIDQIDKRKWIEVLHEMGNLKFYTIPAHPELQKRMIAHYTEFWNENVLKAIPPTVQTYDDIKALCTEPVGTILADETIERLMAEYRNIKSEIGGTGPLAKRADQIKVAVLDYMKDAGAVADDESSDKWILRDNAGNKLASYGRDKNGRIIFR